MPMSASSRSKTKIDTPSLDPKEFDFTVEHHLEFLLSIGESDMHLVDENQAWLQYLAASKARRKTPYRGHH